MGAIADAIVAFTQPLIGDTDGSVEELNEALTLGQLCWNLAVTPEDQRQNVLDGMRSSFPLGEMEFDDFYRSLVMPMIRRHEAMFPRLHGLEAVPPPHGGLPPATPRTSAPEPQTPPVGRYEPCPCNSGKKYKFCCGGKRG